MECLALHALPVDVSCYWHVLLLLLEEKHFLIQESAHWRGSGVVETIWRVLLKVCALAGVPDVWWPAVRRVSGRPGGSSWSKQSYMYIVHFGCVSLSLTYLPQKLCDGTGCSLCRHRVGPLQGCVPLCPSSITWVPMWRVWMWSTFLGQMMIKRRSGTLWLFSMFWHRCLSL